MFNPVNNAKGVLNSMEYRPQVNKTYKLHSPLILFFVHISRKVTILDLILPDLKNILLFEPGNINYRKKAFLIFTCYYSFHENVR